MEAKYFTATEVAKALGVNGKTVARWCKEGKVAHIRTLGGHVRISESELERLRGKG